MKKKVLQIIHFTHLYIYINIYLFIFFFFEKNVLLVILEDKI
jgi:hypothetical protein